MRRPHKAPENSKIGIIATGSIPKRADLKVGTQKLRKMGFEVKDFTSNIKKKINDHERIRNFHAALRDESIDVLLEARGGYGNLRILDLIDYSLVRKARKIIMGFSDISALSLAIYRKTGLVSLSGPMIQTNFADRLPRLTRESFLNNIYGNYGKDTTFDLKDLGGLVLRRSVEEGILLGGNLSIICRMAGSDYLPDFTNAILFIEDVDESYWRLDNMFAQLELCGILEQVSGIIVGQFSNCFKGNKQKRLHTAKNLLADHMRDLEIPIVYNMPFGHESRIITLPIGLPVRLDTRKGTLTYLENPVA